MKKIFNLALIVVTTSSCAISYNMPISRFETSETSTNPMKFSLLAGYGRGAEVELTPDFSTTMADPNKPVLKTETFATVGGYFGLLDGLEVGAGYIGDLGLTLRLKYQFIGKKGEHGFQMAGVLHGGGGSENKEETSHTPTKAELENSYFGADLILGYRFGASFLAYISAFRDKAEYTLKQTRGTVVNNFKGDSQNSGGAVGVDYTFGNGNADILVEYARAQAISATARKTSDAVGARLGVAF